MIDRVEATAEDGAVLPARNERLLAIHSPADRDIVARRRGDVGRPARLFVAPGLVAPPRRFPTHSGDAAASRAQSRHDCLPRHRATRTPVRTNPRAAVDDVVEFVRYQSGHAAI